MNSPVEELTGELAVVHQFVQFAEETVARYDAVTRSFDTVCMSFGTFTPPKTANCILQHVDGRLLRIELFSHILEGYTLTTV